MDALYNNLDTTKSFAVLQSLTPYNFQNFSSQRIEKYDITTSHYNYNFAAKAVDDKILSTLYKLAQEQQIIEKYTNITNGVVMNTSENRMVLHHATRGTVCTDIVKNNRNYHNFYKQQRNKIKDFATAVHNKQITGSNNSAFDTFVQVGIGGSDLGPRAMYLALEQYVQTTNNTVYGSGKFISNVDPDDASAVLKQCNPETTLFILVSKSGTTQETLTNEAFVINWLKQAQIKNPKKHILVVTSETSPLAKSDDYLQSFFIDDFIGGRYSVTSAVGVCILDLSFGSAITDEFLSGAHDADKEALQSDLTKNAALTDALIGVFERNIMKFPFTAVLPYSQALSRFPAHLQQLDMESNGKHVNRKGEVINYSTGPILFGEPGTNGQHSFYQLLHQGTDIVPLQFIGFLKSQNTNDISYESSTSQQKLLANLCAQIIAFALGKQNNNAHKEFKGKRPSSVLYAPQLSPKVLGALLAHFENKVMFQGLIWNINSFDQEGVQLGKALANSVLHGSATPELQTYTKLFKIF